MIRAGETITPPSGKLLGGEELLNMVDASHDGWLTQEDLMLNLKKVSQNFLE